MPPPLTFSVRKLLRGHLGLPAACVCVCVLVMLRGVDKRYFILYSYGHSYNQNYH